MIWCMWFGELGTYIRGKRVVDLVFSKSSKYLRIKVNFFSPSQSLDKFINGRGGKVIPIGSSLSLIVLERSFSLTSWIVSFSDFWIRKRMACCCNWGWVLFLNVYLGSIGTLVFLSWENSPSISLCLLQIHSDGLNGPSVHELALKRWNVYFAFQASR